MEANVATFVSRPVVGDDVAIAFRAYEGHVGSHLLPTRGSFGSLIGSFSLLLTPLRPLLAFLGLAVLGGGFCGHEVKQWLLEDFTCNHKGVGPVPKEFDVPVKNPAVGSAHANVATNPCWEEKEPTVKEVPLRRPRKRYIVHSERLNFRGKPSEYTDDEHHREHHWLHGAHLNAKLLRHHLLLKRHGFFLQDGVS